MPHRFYTLTGVSPHDTPKITTLPRPCVDGVVNEAVVRLLASALPDRERVVICGTGIDTDARPVLRELRPGSTLRKIPAALLQEFRSARQLQLISPEPESSDKVSPDGEIRDVEAKV